MIRKEEIEALKEWLKENGHSNICIARSFLEDVAKEYDKAQKTRPRGTDSARIIQVIETQSLRGDGTEGDMCRIVKQYWDFDGNLLAESDPCEHLYPEEGEEA